MHILLCGLEGAFVSLDAAGGGYPRVRGQKMAAAGVRPCRFTGLDFARERASAAIKEHIAMADYTDREKEEINAINAYTRRSSIQVVEEGDENAAILGTATPFSINSRHYLVTAGHVLEDAISTKQLERIGIRLGETSNLVSNLGNSYIETFKKSDPFDAAVISLDEDPALSKALQQGWRFSSPKDLSSIRPHMRNCFVAGFSRETTRSSGWQLSGNSTWSSVLSCMRCQKTQPASAEDWTFS